MGHSVNLTGKSRRKREKTRKRESKETSTSRLWRRGSCDHQPLGINKARPNGTQVIKGKVWKGTNRNRVGGKAKLQNFILGREDNLSTLRTKGRLGALMLRKNLGGTARTYGTGNKLMQKVGHINHQGGRSNKYNGDTKELCWRAGGRHVAARTNNASSSKPALH